MPARRDQPWEGPSPPHGRRRRRIADQGQDHQQVSGLAATACCRATATCATCRRRTARSCPRRTSAIIYEPLADRRSRAINEIARALKGAEPPLSRHRPRPRGRGDLLASGRGARRSCGAINGVEVKRVVFHEITRRAVLEAMRHPRDLDTDLIDAYQARRALDYLVGFTLSPVLWRKLQGSRSAGRVQSVALRLICEREAEIEAFRPREYWTVEAAFTTPAGATFTARLTRLDGSKLEKFDLAQRGRCQARGGRDRGAPSSRSRASRRSRSSATRRRRSRPRRCSRRPRASSASAPSARCAPPSACSRASRSTARRVGLITYMRTDSVQISREALAACRQQIAKRYGERYLPEQPRAYRTRTKNAQEAHEAIRPTDLGRDAGGRRALPRRRPAPALRADLEADDGEPDGERACSTG